MSQTTYQQDPNVAVAGMLVDASLDKEIITVIANEDIAFGLGVTRESGGAADDRPPRGGLPNASGDITAGVFLGCSRYDASNPAQATPVGWSEDESMSVVRTGRVWVLAEEITAFGDPAFCRYASGGGGTQLGAWRNDADTSTAAQVPGASFRSTTAAVDELAILELRGMI